METEKTKKAFSIEMRRSRIVGYINEKLDADRWTDLEKKFGKRIDFLTEWLMDEKLMSQIVWDYRFQGWHLLDYQDGDERYLLFANPSQRRFNDGREEK